MSPVKNRLPQATVEYTLAGMIVEGRRFLTG